MLEMSDVSITKASVMLLLCVLTITGNAMVVLVGYKYWRHTANHMTHLLVFHLAIADLLEAAIVEPIEFVEELLGEWILGDSACRFIEYFQATALCASVFIITFIAIDRYLSIIRPITGRFKAKHGKYIMIFCWMFPALLSIPYAVIYKLVPLEPGTNKTSMICEPVGIHDAGDRVYWALECYYTFLLPIIVMCFCYTALVRKVLQMKKVGDPMQVTMRASINSMIPQRKDYLTRMKKKSLRLALAFVTLFIICWSPKFALQCYQVVHGTHAVHRKDTLYEVALFMAYTNELLNPVLYALIDSSFRQKLLHLIGKHQQFTTTETNTT